MNSEQKVFVAGGIILGAVFLGCYLMDIEQGNYTGKKMKSKKEEKKVKKTTAVKPIVQNDRFSSLVAEI